MKPPHFQTSLTWLLSQGEPSLHILQWTRTNRPMPCCSCSFSFLLLACQGPRIPCCCHLLLKWRQVTNVIFIPFSLQLTRVATHPNTPSRCHYLSCTWLSGTYFESPAHKSSPIDPQTWCPSSQSSCGGSDLSLLYSQRTTSCSCYQGHIPANFNLKTCIWGRDNPYRTQRFYWPRLPW